MSRNSNELLQEILPVEKPRVMDLVALAGVDINDWSRYNGGKEKAASNPKYCYEWCFIEPGKVVVLNLWHSSMEQQGDTIIQQMNYRRSAEKYAVAPRKPAWERRSRHMDEAIQTAIRESLPVRVIVCDGEQRDINDEDSGPSKVQKRLLDPMTWTITLYNSETGDCTITRGVVNHRFLDQFQLENVEVGEPRKRVTSGEVFARSPEVRRGALSRANGYCEWCGKPGFAMADGKVYLETHHIIPLSEGGPDTIENVVALCPNHHREAHFGAHAREMRPRLISSAAS